MISELPYMNQIQGIYDYHFVVGHIQETVDDYTKLEAC